MSEFLKYVVPLRLGGLRVFWRKGESRVGWGCVVVLCGGIVLVASSSSVLVAVDVVDGVG